MNTWYCAHTVVGLSTSLVKIFLPGSRKPAGKAGSKFKAIGCNYWEFARIARM
jgi:hypothetical protein